METHSLRVPRTARFHTLGEPTSAREVWYLLHGYGQLASAVLEACAILATPERLLVAPEALSRFYTRGGEGAVGASWMTREDRAAEIADYLEYFEMLASHVATLGVARGAPQNLLGFSQGAATASRWACHGSARFEHLILWGGGIAPDLKIGALQQGLERTRITLVHGDADRVFDAVLCAHDSAMLRSARLQVDEATFAGGHAIDPATLERIAR